MDLASNDSESFSGGISMSDVPVQVIVAAFKDENTAKEALKALKEARNQGLIKIVDAAVLRKDEKGKLHIKETADMGGGKGAAIGGVAGGVIGLLAGPVGWAALGGAVLGGLAAKLSDGGFRDERLKKLGEGLGPGNSAIVAVVEHTWVAAVEKQMAEAGADVLTEQISADIAQQLQAGGELALSATATGDALEVSRVAVSDEKLEASKITATAAGVVAEGVVATKDEVVAGVAVITEEGAASVVVDAKAEEPKPVEGEAKAG
jgi:uncharacterized membrane protein